MLFRSPSRCCSGDGCGAPSDSSWRSRLRPRSKSSAIMPLAGGPLAAGCGGRAGVEGRGDVRHEMKPYQRVLLIVFGGLFALTGAGLVVTSDWGSHTVSLAKHEASQAQPPVDMHQMQTAMALAPLAASPEEQDRARDSLRMADHEVDFEFAAALNQAASQPVPSTPEIRAILERISTAEKRVAEIESDVARITKLLAGAKENQKLALAQQLDLANARLELNEDELADAHQDLERAGGDPQSRIQRMVDEHNSAQQDNKGQLDLR